MGEKFAHFSAKNQSSEIIFGWDIERFTHFFCQKPIIRDDLWVRYWEICSFFLSKTNHQGYFCVRYWEICSFFLPKTNHQGLFWVEILRDLLIFLPKTNHPGLFFGWNIERCAHFFCQKSAWFFFSLKVLNIISYQFWLNGIFSLMIFWVRIIQNPASYPVSYTDKRVSLLYNHIAWPIDFFTYWGVASVPVGPHWKFSVLLLRHMWNILKTTEQNTNKLMILILTVINPDMSRKMRFPTLWNFLHVQAQTSLLSLLTSLETPNDVQSVA